MNKALKCAAFAAVTVVGFGVADTTHADGATPPSPGGLAALTAQPDVSGYVGPIALPDGTEVAVITRSDVATMTGTVELAVGRPEGWVVGQSFPIDGFVPDAPDGIGDLTGDGWTEIRVPLIASTGGKGWDLLYQIHSQGPNLEEIPFDTTALEATGIVSDEPAHRLGHRRPRRHQHRHLHSVVRRGHRNTCRVVPRPLQRPRSCDR